MLLYKGEKFHTQGIVFTIPDGFLIDPAPAAIPQNGLIAYTPDERYIVEWDVEEGCHGTKEELEELFLPDSPFIPLCPITPISVNGLSGHQVMCRSNADQRWEMRFSIKDGIELSVCIYTNMKNGNIEDAKDAEFVKEVLAGLGTA